ncbi:MAG: peptidase M14 [Bacteroidetes bacterium]|nr:MAG: peptidase M14 [Bacteroidota bacterium]
MRFSRITLVTLCSIVLSVFGSKCAPLVSAQHLPLPLDMPLPGITSYNSDIPTPEEIIGHQIGTRHTLPYQVEAYFRAVAAVSDRVIFNVYAQSYEGRNLIHAIVTSPSNHSRLSDIKQANKRLSDDPDNVSKEDMAHMPVVVYQGYSIHGNEASGTEAAVLYLYHLAAGEGPAVNDALENAVVILDPMFNPDGRDRFADWANRYRGAVAVDDPQDREHNEGWPGGRTNHYWFDLNRDWLPAQHPESQGRLEVFHSWRPQVLTDHHEMGTGSTFFFQPGIPTRNNPFTPQSTYDLTYAIAKFHARGLDRIGSAYYTEESYDDFYLGKGSAYPDVHGSLGILFEQASSRALERESNGGVLHYAFTVRNQFAASLSTLEGVVALREDLLENQRSFYAGAKAFARSSDVKAYVVSLSERPTRARKMAELLERHRVEIFMLNKDVSIDGIEFEAGGAYVVPVDQAQARFVDAVMETTREFSDSLFYDVSTWTLPLAFDVLYGEYIGSSDLSGTRFDVANASSGRVVGGQAAYAYVLPWDRYYAPRALYRLMQAGVATRVARKPFIISSGGRDVSFERGAIIIMLQPRVVPGQEVDVSLVHQLIVESAREDDVVFYAASTGLTSSGPDLGGSSMSSISMPRIAILSGTGSTSSAAGEAWHMLSERFNMPVSLLDMGRVARADLSRYNVIIHPGGSLSEEATKSIQEWIRGGGRLIAMPSAVQWAIANGYLELESRSESMDSVLTELPFEDRSTARRAQGIGGSIFELTVDNTHPLGYGLASSVPVFRQGSTFYDIPESPGQAFGVYSDSGIMSGYISDAKLQELPGSAGAFGVRSGSGRVIVFMDRLSFRGFWYGSDRLFMNAVFFGGLF